MWYSSTYYPVHWLPVQTTRSKKMRASWSATAIEGHLEIVVVRCSRRTLMGWSGYMFMGQWCGRFLSKLHGKLTGWPQHLSVHDIQAVVLWQLVNLLLSGPKQEEGLSNSFCPTEVCFLAMAGTRARGSSLSSHSIWLDSSGLAPESVIKQDSVESSLASNCDRV